MDAVVMVQEELDKYYKNYLEYLNLQKDMSVESLIEYSVEYFDISGFRLLLERFGKLTKKVQIELIFTIRKLGLSIFSKELSILLFFTEKRITDPFLKKLIIDTIREISDERYILWLLPKMGKETDLPLFLEMLGTIRNLDKSQLVSVFHAFVSFSDESKKTNFALFKHAFNNLIINNNLVDAMCKLALDKTEFKRIFVADNFEQEGSLFNKIICEMLHVDLDTKAEFQQVLENESHGLYSFVLKNKAMFAFSDSVMTCIKSFSKETSTQFSVKLKRYIEEERKVEIILCDFKRIVIELDKHLIEDDLMEQINRELSRNSSDRDMETVISNTMMLLNKNRIIYTAFEPKIFNIISSLIQTDHEALGIYVSYLTRNRIKPSEKIFALMYRSSDPFIVMTFIDYFSTLSQFSMLTPEQSRQVDMFVTGAAPKIVEDEYKSIIFKYLLSRKDFASAITMLKNTFSSGSIKEITEFLEVLEKLNIVEVSMQFKDLLCEIINNASVSKEVRSCSSSIIIDLMEESEEELINFISSLNSLSITIFFERLIQKCSRKTILDVLTRFIDTDKLIVRNYIFNNLKQISDCDVDDSIIDKLIIPIYESNLFCFDVIVFFLNNRCDLTKHRERLEQRFDEMKNPFNRLFLGILLRDSFDYKKQTEEFSSNFVEHEVTDEQLAELHRLSSLAVFNKEVLGYFMKMQQKHIKLMMLRNIASNHKPEMFNQLLTAVRLENQFALQKNMISIISINFNRNHIRPLINIMNIGKIDLTKEIFKLLLTYPMESIQKFLEDEIEEVNKSSRDEKYVNKVKWVIDNLQTMKPETA